MADVKRAALEMLDNITEGKSLSPEVLEDHYLFPKSGFIRNYIDCVSETTDSPPIYHLFSAYAVLSTVIGNRLYIPFGFLELSPNIWVVLIAPSGKFRKTTALSIARHLLWSEEFSKKNVLPNEFSPEQFIARLAENPQGILFVSEFGGLLSMLQKDYMQGMKELLTDLYDSPPIYRRVTKADTFEIKNPTITMLAATTLDWFVDRVKQTDLRGGFLTRLLFVPAVKKEKTMAFPGVADPRKLTLLKSHLAMVHRKIGTRRIAIDVSKIRRQYESFVHKFESKATGGTVDGFVIRLETYALKFAMLNALADDIPSLEVTEKHLEHAIMVVEWVFSQTLKLLQEEMMINPEVKVEQKIIRLLKEAGGSMPQSELLNASRGKDTYGYVKKIVGNLCEREVLVAEVRKATGAGRPQKLWRLVNEAR